MAKPQPRLPGLAGMTEAGFNRVVNTIGAMDFVRDHRCTAPWGWRFPLGCRSCADANDRYHAWHHSLPRTRNAKERKAAARESFFELAKSVTVVDGPLAARVDLLEPTPLQRLLKFAADDGTPVSFEIAEKAMKGGG